MNQIKSEPPVKLVEGMLTLLHQASVTNVLKCDFRVTQMEKGRLGSPQRQVGLKCISG